MENKTNSSEKERIHMVMDATGKSYSASKILWNKVKQLETVKLQHKLTPSEVPTIEIPYTQLDGVKNSFPLRPVTIDQCKITRSGIIRGSLLVDVLIKPSKKFSHYGLFFSRDFKKIIKVIETRKLLLNIVKLEDLKPVLYYSMDPRDFRDDIFEEFNYYEAIKKNEYELAQLKIFSIINSALDYITVPGLYDLNEKIDYNLLTIARNPTSDNRIYLINENNNTMDPNKTFKEKESFNESFSIEAKEFTLEYYNSNGVDEWKKSDHFSTPIGHGVGDIPFYLESLGVGVFVSSKDIKQVKFINNIINNRIILLRNNIKLWLINEQDELENLSKFYNEAKKDIFNASGFSSREKNIIIINKNSGGLNFLKDEDIMTKYFSEKLLNFEFIVVSSDLNIDEIYSLESIIIPESSFNDFKDNPFLKIYLRGSSLNSDYNNIIKDVVRGPVLGIFKDFAPLKRIDQQTKGFLK